MNKDYENDVMSILFQEKEADIESIWDCTSVGNSLFSVIYLCKTGNNELIEYHRTSPLSALTKCKVPVRYDNMYPQVKEFIETNMPIYGIPNSIIRCECGAEKINTTHSNWCPKWR